MLLADGVGVARANDLDLDRLEVILRNGDAEDEASDGEAGGRVQHADVHPVEHGDHALSRGHTNVCAAAHRSRTCQPAASGAAALLQAHL